MKVIDQLFGRLDEYLLSILITSWREEVWQHAIKLIECDHKLEATILDDIKMNVRNKMSVLAI